MKQLDKALKTRQLFSLEMALNICEWRFTVPKTVSACKKGKIWNILFLQASYLAQKWVTFVRHASHSQFVECRQVG